MNQEDWETDIKEYMKNGGWTCDRDDDETIGFSFIQGENHWMRDYDKKERRFVQFDGNQRVNIWVSK